MKDLPPLPEPYFREFREPKEMYTAEQMRTYARAALAQPTASGEPVAEVHPSHLRPAETGNEHWCREVLLYSGNSPHDHGPDGDYRIKLYAAPQPARRPLTDARILDIADDFKSQYQHGGTTFDEFDHLGFARAIEAAHGIFPQQLKDEK